MSEPGMNEPGMSEPGTSEPGTSEPGTSEPGTSGHPMADAAYREVARHHRLIERWLTGAADRAEFAAFADAHAPGFTLAGPDGAVLRLDEVLAAVEAAYGDAPGLTITIRAAHVVAASGDLLVVTYEEWHHTGPGSRGRRATAALRTAPSRQWLHLHETWLP
ncbi:DUF4440 domain-containing protein [Nonomuraea sp. MTCD27]|uniref:DUF4440 domain-containing protein n=1 Tax=Nonomuraea sp. MTCD27 TaxID=1676747 RepID=UPI0035BEDA89